MTKEIYLTSHQAREPYGFSESGWRDAWQNGRVPAPIVIGGKYLWPQSRLEAFESDMLEQAAQREAAIKAANSPETRRAAALRNSSEARQAQRLANGPDARRARDVTASNPRVRRSA